MELTLQDGEAGTFALMDSYLLLVVLLFSLSASGLIVGV